MNKLFRVILPVTDIDKATDFYSKIFDNEGYRVSSGRHYFNCGGVILACFDPKADGDDFTLPANPDHIYFYTDEIENMQEKVRAAEPQSLKEIKDYSYGERSFYFTDPFGNKLCFVDLSSPLLKKLKTFYIDL